ncbi:type II/type IV pathway secretion protein [Salinibacterium hongtaonis]|nr:type II/type IV pathway secretion protein [Salinibacterium hongtaonis]
MNQHQHTAAPLRDFAPPSGSRGGFVPVRPSRTRVEGAVPAATSPIRSTLAPPAQDRRARGRVPVPELGPLAPFVAEAGVTDLFVNGVDGVWVDRGQGVERRSRLALSEDELRELAVSLVSEGGRHIDESSPCVDVRLHDGIRVHAVLPPVSSTGTLISIRIPPVEQLSTADLAAAGFFDQVGLARIHDLVKGRANLLITGAGGSGKTTLLAALLALAPQTERIVTIEDVAELRIAHPHVVSLEARQPNLEGAGGVGLERLVREALRMRPDRLVVGECRGAELRELLAALNTGHDGGAGTLHANSLADVPARLEALGALAGMNAESVARQAVSAIGAVIHVTRKAGVRSIDSIGRFSLDHNDRLTIVEESVTSAGSGMVDKGFDRPGIVDGRRQNRQVRISDGSGNERAE